MDISLLFFIPHCSQCGTSSFTPFHVPKFIHTARKTWITNFTSPGKPSRPVHCEYRSPASPAALPAACLGMPCPHLWGQTEPTTTTGAKLQAQGAHRATQHFFITKGAEHSEVASNFGEPEALKWFKTEQSMQGRGCW